MASKSDSALAHSGLTIGRLKAFCDVIAAGSMVAAADKEPGKQSHYSRQIKDLEKVLGTKLLTKVGKFLRPTEQGKQLAGLTNLYFSGLQELRNSGADSRPAIRVGAGEAVLRWVVFQHLPELLAVTDQVVLEFVSGRTAQIVDGVRTGKFELGIIRDDAVDESLAAISSGTLEYAFVVPRRLLPGRSAAGIEHLHTLPVAAIAGSGQFSRNSLELLKRNGVTPVTRMRAEDLSLVIEAVRTTNVAAFVPRPAIREFSQDEFAVVELDGIERLNRKLQLVYEPKASALRPVARSLGAKIAQICRPTD